MKQVESINAKFVFLITVLDTKGPNRPQRVSSFVHFIINLLKFHLLFDYKSG